MYLSYKKIKFLITLSKKVMFPVPVPFVFRSVTGFQLRRICCIARNNACADCMFNATCIYGLTFESIVPKNNDVMSGRDRISHPIIIGTDDFTAGERDSLVLEIIFLGPTIPYLPYYYYALKKGGEAGILRERIGYRISDVVEFPDTDKERSLVIDERQINTRIEPDVWECDTDVLTKNTGNYKITLVSPLRFKAAGGFYAKRIYADEFAECLQRRALVLCRQYGRDDFTGEYRYSGNWKLSEQNVRWRDFPHYSARQRKDMRIGGMTGDFVLSGEFSPYERGFLRFAELFHGGKSTNFGLGKIKIRETGAV